jgi:hypothetical protein
LTDEKPKRRTIQERVEAIFEFIDRQKDVFPKSRLKEIGLNPETAEKLSSAYEKDGARRFAFI